MAALCNRDYETTEIGVSCENNSEIPTVSLPFSYCTYEYVTNEVTTINQNTNCTELAVISEPGLAYERCNYSYDAALWRIEINRLVLVSAHHGPRIYESVFV